MAHDVFVSYASGDKSVADAVCGTLEAHGIRCWFAPRDVLPGVHYGEAIIDAINESRIMVLVFSSKANLSGHIPKEIERAVSKGITVMPLRIEDVAPAKSLDYFIGSVHWLDALTPPLEAHLERLAANVQTLLSRNAQPLEVRPRSPLLPPHESGTSAAAHPAPPAGRHAWAYAVIGGLTGVIIVLGSLVLWFRSQGRSAAPQTAANSATAQLTANATAPPALKKEAAASPQPAAPKATSASAPKTEPASANQPAASAQPSRARLASTLPAPAPVVNHVIHYVPRSTIKLEQLIGDEDKEWHQPTHSRTVTRYHIQGASLGSSLEHDGHAYFLFGDTIGQLGRALDTIATTNTTEPEHGVQMDFLTEGAAPYLTIQPPGVSMGPFELPVSGISLGGQMYVVVSTNHTPDMPTDRSVLTKFVPPATFQPLRTISQLPAGRFIRMSLHVQPAASIGLPPGGPFIFVWGTNQYRKSDIYMSVVPVSQFESGTGTRYFSGLNAAGAPTWSDNESDATPIVTDGALGDLSVTWCKDLGVWLMTYDHWKAPYGIVFSYSRTPWGPWSDPELLFNAVRDGALGKFIHEARADHHDGLAGPVFAGPAFQNNPGPVRGLAYAPFVVERWTKVQGSELDLYYVLSTWNPYVVVLMKSQLRVE